MKSNRKLLHAALIAALAQWGNYVHAETDDKSLDEVVVTGSRAATKLSETPLTIGTVKKEVIERDKPKTMGEVINRIPGVYWNDLGNEQHSMGIRQPISTNAVYQYLEDGIPFHRGEFGWWNQALLLVFGVSVLFSLVSGWAMFFKSRQSGSFGLPRLLPGAWKSPSVAAWLTATVMFIAMPLLALSAAIVVVLEISIERQWHRMPAV